ncbi:MAG TPA: VOC family protein [Acidimicrobiia bacterium]|nr:VOC family protein [Acidimicrobiia bacterium]
MAHAIQLVYASEDPALLAEFWAGALGYVLQPPPPGFASWEEFADAVEIPPERRNDFGAVIDPDGVGPRILFERWDGGAPTQRLHLDINSVGGGSVDISDEERRQRLEHERWRLESLGATFQREAAGLAGEIWIEMHDPEGNWFCVQ